MGIKYQGDVDFQGAVTMPNLGIDNIAVDGNTISSTSGAINLTPKAGSAVVIDTNVSVDGGVVAGVTTLGVTTVNSTTTNATTVNATGTATIGSSTALTTLTPSYNSTIVDNVLTADGYISAVGIGLPGGQVRNYKFVLPKATSVSAAEAWSGAFITTTLAGDFTFTLPAASAGFAGYHLKIMQTTDNKLRISAAQSGQICTRGNASANNVEFATTSQKIGASVEVICNGTDKWYVMNMSDCTMDINAA